MKQESYHHPRTLAEQYDFQQTLVGQLSTKATDWGVPEEKVQQLQAESTVYETKYGQVSNRQVQSPSLTAGRNSAWKTLQTIIDDIYEHYLLENDAISSEDKETLHIYEHRTSYFRYDAPKFSPDVDLTAGDSATLFVNYTQSVSSTSHRKPDGVVFCELVYKVGADAPASIDECNSNALISRSHQRLSFSQSQRGKTIYAYARWVNRNGKNGPWSNQISAIIP